MSHGRDTSPKPFAVVAEFDSPDQLLHAAEKLNAEGYRDVEAYSPVPVHGLTDKLEFNENLVWWITILGGATGMVVGMFLEWYTSTGVIWPWFVPGPTGIHGYAHIVGGKPLFSIPAFVPVAYECTILLSAFGATFGMLGLNGLPKPHQPIMQAECMKRASQDRYVVAVMTTDPRIKPLEDDHGHQRWDEDTASELEKLLWGFKPLSVERVKTAEGY